MVSSTRLYNLYIGYTCPFCNSPVIERHRVSIKTSYNDSALFELVESTDPCHEAQMAILDTVKREITRVKNNSQDLQYLKNGKWYMGHFSTLVIIPSIDATCPFCHGVSPWKNENSEFSFSELEEKNYPTVLSEETVIDWLAQQYLSQKNEIKQARNNDGDQVLSDYRIIRAGISDEIEKCDQRKREIQHEKTERFNSSRTAGFIEKRRIKNDLEKYDIQYRKCSKQKEHLVAKLRMDHWYKVIENGYDGSIIKYELYKDNDDTKLGGSISCTLSYPNDTNTSEDLNTGIELVLGKKLSYLNEENDSSNAHRNDQEKELSETIEDRDETSIEPVLFCHKCGYRLHTDSMFCSRCGTRIKK